LDIAGPAWFYVLIRAQYKSKNAAFLGIRFSPDRAFVFVIAASFSIEIMQFFEVYHATFDPYDFICYASGTMVVYVLDKWIV
jgi:hypothetical protein